MSFVGIEGIWTNGLLDQCHASISQIARRRADDPLEEVPCPLRLATETTGLLVVANEDDGRFVPRPMSPAGLCRLHQVFLTHRCLSVELLPWKSDEGCQSHG